MRTINFTSLRFLTFGVVLACLPVLHAADPIEVQWDDMCRATQGNEINIKTATGESVAGYCIAIRVDEMSVRTIDGKVVKLARTAMHQIRMHRAKSHQLRALGHGMREALHGGFDFLFSPLAPVGLVSVPGTLAWGAVAAPFCAISDLHDKLKGTREIKVM